MFLWVLIVAWVVLITVIVDRIGKVEQYGVGGCTPADDFLAPYQGTYNRWDVSKIFQITVGFGTLSFSKAKLIDTVWDVVVGRGGQSALMSIAYKIYTSALMRILENSTVSYRIFAALTFETATLATIYNLVRDFWTNAKLYAKFAILWILLSSAWIALFPTFTSAMTGYAANVDELVSAKDGARIDYAEFLPVNFVVHDGWRIGLEGDHIVYSGRTFEECLSDTLEQHVAPEYALTCRISQYTSMYGDGPLDQNSTFMSTTGPIDLPAPILNISSFDGVAGIEYIVLPAGETLDGMSFCWAYKNTTYSPRDIGKAGICTPNETYKWGFSFLLLFIFCVMQLFWFLGMNIMWLDAHLASRFNRAGRDIGIHRAALDFANAMKKDMGEDVAECVGNAEIRRRMLRRLNGGSLFMAMSDPSTLPMSRGYDFKIRWMKAGVMTKFIIIIAMMRTRQPVDNIPSEVYSLRNSRPKDELKSRSQQNEHIDLVDHDNTGQVDHAAVSKRLPGV
ncbi:MAG: hypothetical protein Q9160_006364 [Pyrenula sp. 1 TL-2023]